MHKSQERSNDNKLAGFLNNLANLKNKSFELMRINLNFLEIDGIEKNANLYFHKKRI